MGVSRSRLRPPHRDLLPLLGIGLGGALGTVTRAELSRLWPVSPGDFPWTTFVINLTGAVVLSFLLEALGRRGPDSGRRRLIRLTVGTGLIGGYTTYSTFAVETVQALAVAPLVGVCYLVASVVGGPLAAVLGYLAARRLVPLAGKAVA
ncbi:fluoride efflux transporter FluC [Propionicicella superfundia]|uniref:fluoride efflux transporter FluC n=1 Tax=Propionicicella superfundia TaxID=348582 RepID=UPI0003F9D8A2|nr:CrcB family protein [Propionicicella superfundia]